MTEREGPRLGVGAAYPASPGGEAANLDTFGEPVTAAFDHVFRGRLLHRERSAYQKVEVFEHEYFGRVLVLDDLIQTTERDEFCYHEMLVHPALASREDLERVLVIGGGDGGALRHVLMHSPAEAVMCEIDEAVTRASREHVPSISGDAFDDPRTTLVFDDGAAYVASRPDSFDVIVVDSTDPIGPAVVLFSPEFYATCRRALRPGGVIVTQSGSPMYQADELGRAVASMRSAFGAVEVYTGFVPTYPGVLWSFTCGTDGALPSSTDPAEVERRLLARGVSARFYSPGVHSKAFELPVFVSQALDASA